MKLKITPLLVVSVIIILCGIFYTLSGAGGNLGPLFGMIIIFKGAICLIPYFILKFIFKSNIRWRVIIELFLIVIIALVFYFNWKPIGFGFGPLANQTTLRLPRSFHGHIILVYGVDKKLNPQAKNLSSQDVDIVVPGSGIIFTSGTLRKNLIIVDSTDKEVKTMTPGYGVSYINDTLRCGNKKYMVDILFPGTFSSFSAYTADSVQRNTMKEEACKILSE